MTPTGFAPSRPMIGTNPNQANRSAIANMMAFGGGQNGFGMAPRPPQNFGPPGLPAGQSPVPPSLGFTPGVGTSSPAMTNWRPPTYPPQGPPGNSNPMPPATFAPVAPGTAPNMQAQPVNAANPYMRPMTR